MLKKSAIGVLASLRGSELLEGSFRSPRSILRANGHTKCGWYLLASSLAAALLDELFEHPAEAFSPCPRRAGHQSPTMPPWFFRNLSDRLRLLR
jgi:hypothetical protein